MIPKPTKRTYKLRSRGAKAAALLAFALAALQLLAACGAKEPEPVDPEPAHTAEIVDILPGNVSTPDTAVTPAPTPAPTPEPDTLEGRILAGLVHPLNGGEPLDSSWEGERIDIDGDGAQELISVEQVDGGDTVCISGEPFLDGGVSVRLASPDGQHIVFITQKPSESGYRLFYPDRGGNLFCRLFAICREGNAEDFEKLPSYEDHIRSGLDIMLHNPMLYSSVSGDKRTLLLDMNGDGSKEEIVFDSELLTINGLENRPILSTTMPRFIYDAEHDAIVLSGSAGDYALSLRYDGNELFEDISYASLL